MLLKGRSGGLRAQLVRQAMGVGGLKVLSLPLTLGASVLLARTLEPDGYGQYVFVMALITLLALPIGPGIGQLVTREVARCHHDRDWSLFRGLLRWAHGWVLLGTGIIMSCVWFAVITNATWGVRDRWTLTAVASLMLPLLGLNALRSHTLRGLRHPLPAQLPDLLVRPASHLAIASGFLLIGALSPATALISQIGAMLIACILAAWLLSRYQPSQVAKVKPEYRHNEWGAAIWPFTVLAAVSTFNAQIGVLALGWLGSNEDVAVFRVAQSGGMLVVFALTIVNLVIGPYITQAFRDGDRDRMQQLSRQSARGALAAALPVALPLIAFGEQIVRWIYGDAYALLAAWPLAILALGQLINVAFGPVGFFLSMSGFERDSLMGQLFGLVANLLLALVLIPKYGALGAALSVSIGLVVWNTTVAIKFRQRLQLRPGAI